MIQYWIMQMKIELNQDFCFLDLMTSTVQLDG